jgi:hypothetical protein
MLACNKDDNENRRFPTFWVLDGDLHWDEEKNEFVTLRASRNMSIGKVTSIPGLGTKALIDFASGLFEAEGHAHSDLVHLFPKLQRLLLLFKRWCEDDLLQEESQAGKWPGGAVLKYPILENELQNSAIANAVDKLKKCKMALESWSFQNDYPKDKSSLFKTERFSRSENSLSAVLEKSDQAQENLRAVRVELALYRAEVATTIYI